MTRRCIALLSGGLDSMLAIRIMQRMDIEVEAINFKTMFTCCQDASAQAARDLGVKLTVLQTEEDYLDLIKNPEFGYGKGANPCVDCRIYMFKKAKRYMEQTGASFIISGEVVGQRPMSQKKQDLDIISCHSDLEGLLLRPLSAKLLPPTLPEREGWVDREKLYDIQGRSRKQLIKLAHEFELKEIPTPSTGCSLTEPLFSRKVFDLFQIEDSKEMWDYELLKIGKHYRFDNQTKVIVARNEEEYYQLQYFHEIPESRSEAFIDPDDFAGPGAIIAGPLTDQSLDYACGLVLRFANSAGGHCRVRIRTRDSDSVRRAVLTDDARTAETVATV